MNETLICCNCGRVVLRTSPNQIRCLHCAATATTIDTPCPQCGCPKMPQSKLCNACHSRALEHAGGAAERPSVPCPHPPGSAGRIEAYIARVDAGVELHHPDDAIGSLTKEQEDEAFQRFGTGTFVSQNFGVQKANVA